MLLMFFRTKFKIDYNHEAWFFFLRNWKGWIELRVLNSNDNNIRRSVFWICGSKHGPPSFFFSAECFYQIIFSSISRIDNTGIMHSNNMHISDWKLKLFLKFLKHNYMFWSFNIYISLCFHDKIPTKCSINRLLDWNVHVQKHRVIAWKVSLHKN